VDVATDGFFEEAEEAAFGVVPREGGERGGEVRGEVEDHACVSGSVLGSGCPSPTEHRAFCAAPSSVMM